MDNRYDILKSISQGENGTLPEENADLVKVANVIRRAATSSFRNDAELCTSVMQHLSFTTETQRTLSARSFFKFHAGKKHSA